MLDIPYGSDVPPALIEVMEHHARHIGLSLEALERVGRSLADAEAFILAAEGGQGDVYAAEALAAVDAPPRALLAACTPGFVVA